MGAHKNPTGISGVLRDVLDQGGLAHLLAESRLRQVWVEILGERAAQLATLQSLRDGVLRMRVENDTWRMELSFRREDIRRKAEALLGPGSVREVVVG